MDTIFEINTLRAELNNCRLTRAERRATIAQLTDLHDTLRTEAYAADDAGDRPGADQLFQTWFALEAVLERECLR